MKDLVSKIQLIILFTVSTTFTLFTYRTIFAGKLYGEPFDSRLMISIHEHWWYWFNGTTQLRNTQFFYPFEKALGYSDSFLVQGIIYSLFRFVSLDIPSSWVFTTTFLLIVGNFGWIFVAKTFLKKFVTQIFFVITTISSLSFVSYFTLNPNFVGYTYLSWFLLFYYQIIYEKNLIKKSRKIWLFVISITIYALSCWYAAFFLILIILLHNIFSFIRFKKLAINLFKFNFKHFLIFSPILGFFIWLFIYIYVLVSNQPYRPVAEMLGYSPKLNNLINAGRFNDSNLNGAIFKEIYFAINQANTAESSFGIGIFSIILIFVLSFIYFRQHSLDLYEIIWIFSITIPYLIFLNINGFSIFSLFYESVPGLNSIRYPNRYIIILGYFIIFIIFLMLDRISFKGHKYKTFAITFLFMSLVFLDQVRSPFQGWERNNLINKELFAQISEIKENCEYFYYDYPGGWWYDQIEAMTFSMQIGIPTVNGYSGAFPPNYPTESFYSEKMPKEIFKWINKIDSKKTGCLVTGRTQPQIISKNLNSINLIGFTGIESDGKNRWNWAISQNPYIYIVNLTNKDMLLNFELKSSKCNISEIIEIKESDGQIFSQKINNDSSLYFNAKLNFSNTFVKKIDFINDLKPCQIEDDPRQLYFEIKNLNYTVAE